MPVASDCRCPACWTPLVAGLSLSACRCWAPTVPWRRLLGRQPTDNDPLYQQWLEGYRPCCSTYCAAQADALWLWWRSLSPAQQEAEAALGALDPGRRPGR